MTEPRTAPATEAISATAREGNGVAHTRYLICTVPRSGSWLLADALQRTAVAGCPEEFFRAEDVEDHMASWRHDPRAGLRTLLALIRYAGLSPNRVFGMKAHWSQLADLAERLRTLPEFAGLTRQEAVENALGGSLKYVYLRRSDKLRQAISYYRALETDVWWWLEDWGSPGDAGFGVPDGEVLAALEGLLRQHDKHWIEYFAEADADPLVVDYEQLVADYVSTVRAVLEYLGLPERDVPPPRLRRQADSLTEHWVHHIVTRRRVHESPDIRRYGLVANGLG